MSYQEKLKYIQMKYTEYGISFDEETLQYTNFDEIGENWFLPFINPLKQDIPICTSCLNDYEYVRKNGINDNNEIEIKHPSGCLWYDYFLYKLREIYPRCKIVKNKKK